MNWYCTMYNLHDRLIIIIIKKMVKIKIMSVGFCITVILYLDDNK